MLNRKVGFDREEIGDGVAFLIGELSAETVRAEDGLALWLRHLAQVAEGASDQAATVLGKSTVFLQRAADLLALRWSEVLHLLGALKDAPALLGCHIVTLREAVPHGLLGV